jgi:hypothetical protein
MIYVHKRMHPNCTEPVLGRIREVQRSTGSECASFATSEPHYLVDEGYPMDLPHMQA